MKKSPSKTVAIIQARMTSNRLPGKVLKPLAGEPMILRVLQRIEHICGVDDICLAVPESDIHDPIVEVASKKVGIFRGDEFDVLDRTLKAGHMMKADTVMRITSDCPIIDPKVSSLVLSAFSCSEVVYARTAPSTGYPHGFDTEVFTIEALAAAHARALSSNDREHVTPFIRRHPDQFPTLELDFQPDRRHWRLTVDTREDYDLVSRIYDRLYSADPLFGFDSLEKLFAVEPELLDINRGQGEKSVGSIKGISP